ncbi:MAG: hypothetical protein RIB32_03835 [Phycisphaerales bacterium]
MNRRSVIIGMLAGAAMAFAGCAREERVVGVRGGFQRIPGASGGYGMTGAPRSEDWVGFLDRLNAEPNLEEGAVVDEGSLRVIHDDGSVTLTLRAPRHVIYHILQTLRAKEYDLLFEQVISDRSKEALIEQDRDPFDAVAYLVRNQEEIEAFFKVIPFGEQTPGVLQESIGRNAFRIAGPGGGTGDTKFSALDVVIEDGEFRLLNVH